MFKLRNILENKLFKTFVLFSVFRAIYGALVLFISYFLSTTYDDGILFTILFLVITLVVVFVVVVGNSKFSYV